MDKTKKVQIIYECISFTVYVSLVIGVEYIFHNPVITASVGCGGGIIVGCLGMFFIWRACREQK